MGMISLAVAGRGPVTAMAAEGAADAVGKHMRIEERYVAGMKPADYNPRTISDKAMAGLKASIKRWGIVEPIIVNERTGNIVGGHQRLRVLLELGEVKTDAVIIDIDESEERALNVTLNNPHIAGEFLPDLQNILEGFKLDIPDAFEALNLDELYKPDPKDGNTDPDAVPESAPATVKTGEIWQLGKHRVMCGDSTKAEDVERLMEGEKAALMNTDPPYGIDYVNLKDSKHKDIKNDDLVDGKELQAFLESAIRVAVPHLKINTAFYLWHPMLTQGTFFAAAAAAAAADILIHRQIIWVKPSLVLTRSGMYHWKHELCFYGWQRGNQPPWYGDKTQTSVWEVGREGKGEHPTQKPVELFTRPIMNHTKPDEIIYEPFAGSGSQVIAAEQTERVCRAIEIEPKYCDVIIKRWEDFAGQKASKLK